MNGRNATSKIYPARQHFTFTSAQLLDVDAIKTSIASNVAAQTYPADGVLDGALVSGGVAYMRLPQVVTVSSSASGATYNTTDPIVFTGTDWFGVAATDSLTLVAAGGNETIVGTVGLYTVTGIAVPAQLGGGGAFTFGVRDVLFPDGYSARQIRHGSDGNILVEFIGLSNARNQDTVPGIVGERHDAFYKRIYGTAATTSTSMTIYI